MRETYDPLPLLRAKVRTLIMERNAGRGDYDRLGAILDDLRDAINRITGIPDEVRAALAEGSPEAATTPASVPG